MKSDLEVMREILIEDMRKIHEGNNVDLEKSKQLNNHVRAMVEVGKLEVAFIEQVGMQGSLQNSMIQPKKELK
jgi:hypothetical protein